MVALHGTGNTKYRCEPWNRHFLVSIPKSLLKHSARKHLIAGRLCSPSIGLTCKA